MKKIDWDQLFVSVIKFIIGLITLPFIVYFASGFFDEIFGTDIQSAISGKKLIAERDDVRVYLWGNDIIPPIEFNWGEKVNLIVVIGKERQKFPTSAINFIQRKGMLRGAILYASLFHKESGEYQILLKEENIPWGQTIYGDPDRYFQKSFNITLPSRMENRNSRNINYILKIAFVKAIRWSGGFINTETFYEIPITITPKKGE